MKVLPSFAPNREPALMLLIGARFRTLAAARAALRGLRAAVPVPTDDVAVVPLGSTRYDASEELFLLAGRFDPGDAVVVTSIIHSEGGRIIERRSDEPASEGRPAPELTRLAVRLTSRPKAPITGFLRGPSRARQWLRRPSPPLRVRTARALRSGG